MDAANCYNSHLHEDYYTLRPLLWWFPEMAGGRWSIGQWLNFRLHSEAPDLHHFVDIHDATDPLNIHEGNASLSNTYTQNMQLGYRRVSKRNHLYASANYHYTHNALAMSSLFDPQTGVKTYKPCNINGNWNSGFSLIFSTPLDKKKQLNITIGPSFRYTHSVDLTGTTTLQRSTVGTTRLAPKAELSYKLASHTFRLIAEPTWQLLYCRKATKNFLENFLQKSHTRFSKVPLSRKIF